MSSLPVYIGVGSNLGDRKANIEKAIELVKLIKGVEMERASSVYETEPVGGPACPAGRPPQMKFLNGVLKIKTAINPFKILG